MFRYPNLLGVRRRVHFSSTFVEPPRLAGIIAHGESQGVWRALHVPSSGRYVLVNPCLVVRSGVTSEYSNAAWIAVLY